MYVNECGASGKWDRVVWAGEQSIAAYIDLACKLLPINRPSEPSAAPGLLCSCKSLWSIGTIQGLEKGVSPTRRSGHMEINMRRYNGLIVSAEV